MAKIYEALRRAEEERKLKTHGASEQLPALKWDSTPGAASKRTKLGKIFRRKASAEKRSEPERSSVEANKRRIALLEPGSFIAEQFRMLRSRVDSLAIERPLKTIAITSANSGDGKSNVAINLAVVTAMSVGRRVLLVDCDMRRPMVHRSLGVEPKLGLAEVLSGRANADDAIFRVDAANLDLLGVRMQPQNPSELLGSSEMRILVEQLAGRYDRIILDTPAALGLPDAKIVAGLCDAYLMVVRAGGTAREEVEAALEVLDRRRAVGLVLNGADMGHEGYAYY
jgi:capsular exopolysaccharide synthesis family protein